MGELDDISTVLAEEIKQGYTYAGRTGRARTVKTLCQKYDGERWILWEVKGDDESRYQGSLKDFASWVLYEIPAEVGANYEN